MFNNIIWMGSLISFMLGISLPMFTLETLILFKDSFSLLGGIMLLLKQGDVLLSLTLFFFSVVTPVYKSIISFQLLNKKLSANKKLTYIRRLALIGKWSMADVFVIAILAATLKLGGLASVNIKIGLLFYGMSVLGSMWLSHRLSIGYKLLSLIEEKR